MRHLLPVVAASFLCLPLAAQDKPSRPKITGIDHVRISVTDLGNSRRFYAKLFGIRPNGGACDDKSGRCFTVGKQGNQRIELEHAPASGTKNRMAEIAFATDDVEKMRSYLVAHRVSASKISKYRYDKQIIEAQFEVRDPEGNPISFIQRFFYAIDDPGFGDPWFVRIIHAGLVVRDRPAEDHFYKDILGFHLYWQGGRKDDETSWVNMQVPDGTDWIEYMLNVSPNADKRELGVMNHIALGVPDIRVAREQLIKNGWKPGEEPKIGRGGKWQLNLYDPDDTRVEFMEFTPVQKPCCSDYTGPHPGSKQ
jgi:catechol 2,3-dioxygenase-like lactoylglutathione lyase family enzyme